MVVHKQVQNVPAYGGGDWEVIECQEETEQDPGEWERAAIEQVPQAGDPRQDGARVFAPDMGLRDFRIPVTMRAVLFSGGAADGGGATASLRPVCRGGSILPGIRFPAGCPFPHSRGCRRMNWMS